MSSHSSVAIEDITGISERTVFQKTVASQAFWVTVAVALICLATAYEQPDAFATLGNFFNITRNFAAIGIMALGMTAVIVSPARSRSGPRPTPGTARSGAPSAGQHPPDRPMNAAADLRYGDSVQWTVARYSRRWVRS